MLEWDETEFIECLESIPEEVVDEFVGELFIFNVKNNGIQLELKVFPLVSDISLKLLNIADQSVIFDYHIMDCESAEYQKLISGTERLRFINSLGMQIDVSIRPNIKISIK